ncbi:hypothetical protein AB0M68_34625 [Streptomyces sp. NPDC051453]
MAHTELTLRPHQRDAVAAVTWLTRPSPWLLQIPNPPPLPPDR